MNYSRPDKLDADWNYETQPRRVVCWYARTMGSPNPPGGTLAAR